MKMKQIKFWMLAAIATLCGATMFTSCSNDDNPSTPQNGQGQTGQSQYYSMFSEGKTWKYTHIKPFSEDYYNFSLVVRGDTTINGLTYKKIYDVSTDTYQYALREDGKKVYCVFQTKDTPQLIYDFGKEAGEIISEAVDKDSKTVLKVLAVDVVKYGDRLLRRMEVVEEYLENDQVLESSNGIWIEGLGSFCGLVSPVQHPGNYNTFHSCQIGDEILGESELFWAKAQGKSYDSFLSEGKVWTMSYRSPYIADQVTYIESKLEGDTIIGNVAFKRKYTRELKQGNGTPLEWKATNYYVGQAGDKVYYYDTYNEEPQLLMDFSAKAGDVIPYNTDGMSGSLKVESVSDTVFVSSTDRQSRKCIYVREYDMSDVWVEGVGSIKYGIESYFTNPIVGGIPLLTKCTKGEMVLYEYQE